MAHTKDTGVCLLLRVDQLVYGCPRFRHVEGFYRCCYSVSATKQDLEQEI